MAQNANNTVDQLLHRVQTLVTQRLTPAVDALGQADSLRPGKMLRTRLAARLLSACPAQFDTVAAACAAAELVHTASLCHDDVIDRAPLRRGAPAVWQSAGPSAAILVGDLILCSAVDLARQQAGDAILKSLLEKVHEVVAAEIEQELALRGRQLDETTCLRIARSKTGPLFAFVAGACAANDPELADALSQAGYDVGAAYQLADDRIDLAGDDHAAGKTLGTDRLRQKCTLAQLDSDGDNRTARHVDRLFASALDRLHPWPIVRDRLREYIHYDLTATRPTAEPLPAIGEDAP